MELVLNQGYSLKQPRNRCGSIKSYQMYFLLPTFCPTCCSHHLSLATDDNNNNNNSISIDDSSTPPTGSLVEIGDEGISSSHPVEAKRKAIKSNQEVKKSSPQQITTLISSVIEQQKKDYHFIYLFNLI